MMKEEVSIYDPLGIEIFAIDETFESMFNALKGVYFRLYYKESISSNEVRNIEQEKMFYNRYREISDRKRSYKYNDWVGKRQAVKDFSEELKKMIALELQDVETI